MSKKQVFAHLCTWFQAPEISGKWEMWNSAYENALHDPEKFRSPDERDIAAFGYPLTGPYDSSDDKAVRYQLSLMKLCGVDGVIVDWDGRRINRYRHEMFLRLLPLLPEFGLKLIVCFEEWCGYHPAGTYGSRAEEVSAALNELIWLNETVIKRPYYAELSGKKPVFVFRKVPESWFLAEEWEVLKRYGKEQNLSFYFEDCYHPEVQKAADGWFFWVGGFDENLQSDLAYQERTYDAFEKQCAALPARPVVPSAVPGFDDTCVWGWGGGKRVAPRFDGKRYEHTFEHAIASGAEAVQIVTWNDWNEGSHIEPSTEFGYRYLELTKKYAAKFKESPDTVPDETLRIPLEIYRLRSAGKNKAARMMEKKLLQGRYDQLK